MTTKGTSIAGRKRNDKIDFYQTPTWCIEKLLEKENFSQKIWEPCSGSGAISKVLEKNGYDVLSTELRTDENVYGLGGKNFLEIENKLDMDIVTNPPYFIGQEFIEHSLKVGGSKVAMLLKLSFLESTGRYEFFKNTPLKKVYVLCKRVTMYPEGTPEPENNGMIAYAWYIWEKGYKGEPIIDWII